MTSKERVELARMGSLCQPDPQVELLEAWDREDLAAFREWLQKDAVVDHWYENKSATCLQLVCASSKGAPFAEELLKAGADPGILNKISKKAPIHIAAEAGNLAVLGVLMAHRKTDINELDSSGDTALHKIAKQKDSGEKYAQCAKLLLNQDGVRPNQTNRKRYTPILVAAQYGTKEVVQTILENTADDLDVDSVKALSGKTAREIIIEKHPDLAEKLPEKRDGESADNRINADAASLFQMLYSRNYEGFVQAVENLSSTDLLNSNDGSRTLLQHCAHFGLEPAARVLIDRGVDPNGVCKAEPRSPAMLACLGGHPTVLKLFLVRKADALQLMSGTGSPTALHLVLTTSPRDGDETRGRNHKACLELLLQYLPHLKLDINATDLKGNTALHYAAKNGDEHVVLTLLKNGAYIGIRNVFGEPPLANLSSRILEQFLNECIGTNGEFPREDTYEITFSYLFLVPPPANPEGQPNIMRRSSQVALTIPGNHHPDEYIELPSPKIEAPSEKTNTETDPLLYISRSRDLRYLLNHPVFASFLHLKWHRIRIFFCLNLIFYLFFVGLLSLYILLGLGKLSDDADDFRSNSTTIGVQLNEDEPMRTNGRGFTWWLLSVFFVLLFLRELFQFAVSPGRYFRTPENYLELLLLGFSAAVLLCGGWGIGLGARPHFSAVAILLSWAELVLLIGRHPRLATNIEMFKTVSWNFLKFLAWYAILIVAFALSFYTLFRDGGNGTADNHNKTDDCGDEEGEENFFLDPGMSVFKTVVMLTGEFDAASIPFVLFPGTSHVVFVLFVFLIAIVLFNLLNGLAVSDTQAIRKDAEVVALVSRVKFVSYVESMFLSKPFSCLDPLKRACCWWPDCNVLSLCNFVTNRVRLFPETVPESQIRVLPNQGARILFISFHKKRQEMKQKDENVRCCPDGCSGCHLDSDIVKRAIEIVGYKGSINDKENTENEIRELRHALEENKKILGEYERRFDSIEASLARVLDLLVQPPSSNSSNL